MEVIIELRDYNCVRINIFVRNYKALMRISKAISLLLKNAIFPHASIHRSTAEIICPAHHFGCQI